MLVTNILCKIDPIGEKGVRNKRAVAEMNILKSLLLNKEGYQRSGSSDICNRLVSVTDGRTDFIYKGS